MLTMLTTLAIGDVPCRTPASPADAPSSSTPFESRGEDTTAIEALLHTYTKAVSAKDQALFESLLLTKRIPFSSVKALGDADAPFTFNYEAFRRGVFEGPPFEQRFERVQITQDGPFAAVILVFVNTRKPEANSWGWKTLQLVKTPKGWKIASEFYTGHAGRPDPL